MVVGLFEQAKEALDRVLEKRNEVLRLESLDVSARVASIFEINIFDQSRLYGNEWPAPGGLQLGPIWFEKGLDRSVWAGYVCPHECYKKLNRWVFHVSVHRDENLARLGELVERGCIKCGYKQDKTSSVVDSFTSSEEWKKFP